MDTRVVFALIGTFVIVFGLVISLAMSTHTVFVEQEEPEDGWPLGVAPPPAPEQVRDISVVLVGVVVAVIGLVIILAGLALPRKAT